MKTALIFVSAFGIAMLSGLQSAVAETPSTAKPEKTRMEVTGSRITQEVRRIGRTTDTISPVFVIDRKEIERSGATSVAALIRARVPFAH